MADKDRVQEQLQEITEQLEQGTKEVFTSEKYQQYLDVMGRFHNYSANNTMLIAMQKPDATLVAGFEAWKNKFERYVKKGERGISIISPVTNKRKEKIEKIDPYTMKPILDGVGKPVMEEIESTKVAFRITKVFDVSQTDGKELPSMANELVGTVEHYEVFMKAFKEISPVPIGFEEMGKDTKGYYHQVEKRIALQEGMSELQTMKTTVHELAHAILHDKDMQEVNAKQQKDSRTKEVEAESVAYTVSKYYGLDTSDYSFEYIAGWSGDKKVPELKKSLETIKEASAKLITEIDTKLKEYQQDKSVEMPEIEEEDNAKRETGISFYVAECAEFHNLGEYHENLTLQEAIEIYNAIPSERMRGIREIGCELVTNSEDNYGNVVSLFRENSIEMDTVHLLHFQENPLVKSAMRELLVAYPDANIVNRDAVTNFVEDMRAVIRELYFDDEETQKKFTGEIGEIIGPHLTREDIEEICAELEMSIREEPSARDVTLAKTILNKLNDIWLRKDSNSLGAELEEPIQRVENDSLNQLYNVNKEQLVKYYPINEQAAKRAKELNSFYDYKLDSETVSYRAEVDKAMIIAENQKAKVDSIHHSKIDRILDTYARKLAQNINNSFAIDARVPSVMIVGSANFPTKKKEKQNIARDKNMAEWKDIQGLLEKIKSTGMGGISADDKNAIPKLQAKLEKLEQLQQTMKDTNAYYRKNKTLDACPFLDTEQLEELKESMDRNGRFKPFETFLLSGNNAEIKRIKSRIAGLVRKNETTFLGWKFDGGSVEINKVENRLQVFFENKPDTANIAELKKNGFRWAPSVGAWQRQLNNNSFIAANRVTCIKPITGERPTDLQKQPKPEQLSQTFTSIEASENNNTSAYIFKAYVVNISAYDNGDRDSGAWLYLPSADGEVADVLEKIGLSADASPYDYFIDDYKSNIVGLQSLLPMYANIEDLEKLAQDIASLPTESYFELKNIQLCSKPFTSLEQIKEYIALQLQLNDNSLLNADHISRIRPITEERPADLQQQKVDDIYLKRESNPLAKVEELEEQNYNQIDGMLNNISPERKLPKGSIRTKLEAAKDIVAQRSESNRTQTNLKEGEALGN